MHAWHHAFLLTQLVEVPVYLMLLPLPLWRRAVVAFLASALTHPYVWFVLSGLLPTLGFWGYAALAETFAVVVEASWLMFVGVAPKRAALAALSANASSFCAGLLLWG